MHQKPCVLTNHGLFKVKVVYAIKLIYNISIPHLFHIIQVHLIINLLWSFQLSAHRLSQQNIQKRFQTKFMKNFHPLKESTHPNNRKTQLIIFMSKMQSYYSTENRGVGGLIYKCILFKFVSFLWIVWNYVFFCFTYWFHVTTCWAHEFFENSLGNKF